MRVRQVADKALREARMPRYDGPSRSIEDLDAAKLETYRRMFHAELGVAAALHYCTEHDLDAPRWLITAATELIFALLRNEKSKKRGRACGIVARYRQDMIDFERWERVREVREMQEELPEVVEDLRSRNAPSGILEEREKMRDWTGEDWLKAYECASMVLQGTDAHAGPDAMKTSYQKVQQNNRHPSQSLRYHVLGRAIECRLGLDCSFPRRVNKYVPFFDLTL
jgi:hypothetical protein